MGLNTKLHTATEKEIKVRWDGGPSERFRCYLCGHKFKLGDMWRWVYGDCRTVTDLNGKTWGVMNFMTCADCDGDDVLDRWVERNQEYYTKFWWMI